MNKFVFVFLISIFSYSYGQENCQYMQIGFYSICCGTPSEKPTLHFIKDFQKENKLKNLEIWFESGLGEEGEFAIYIGLDQLNKKQKAQFLEDLKLIADNFNKQRKRNHDGYINVDEKLVTKEFLIQKRNRNRNQFSILE